MKRWKRRPGVHLVTPAGTMTSLKACAACVCICECTRPKKAVLESFRPIPFPPLSIEKCLLKRPVAPLCSRGQAFGPNTNMHSHTHTFPHTHVHTHILGSEDESDISALKAAKTRGRRRMSGRITKGFMDSFPLIQAMRCLFHLSLFF